PACAVVIESADQVGELSAIVANTDGKTRAGPSIGPVEAKECTATAVAAACAADKIARERAVVNHDRPCSAVNRASATRAARAARAAVVPVAARVVICPFSALAAGSRVTRERAIRE